MTRPKETVVAALPIRELEGRPETPAERDLRLNVKKLLRDRPQRDLARQLGMSDGWVSEFLAGKKSIPMRHLDVIAAFFQVETRDLLKDAYDFDAQSFGDPELDAEFRETAADLPRQTPTPKSPGERLSTSTGEGDDDDSAETRLVSEREAALQSEIDTLRDMAGRLLEIVGRHADAQTARTKTSKPSSRKRA